MSNKISKKKFISGKINPRFSPAAVKYIAMGMIAIFASFGKARAQNSDAAAHSSGSITIVNDSAAAQKKATKFVRPDVSEILSGEIFTESGAHGKDFKSIEMADINVNSPKFEYKLDDGKSLYFQQQNNIYIGNFIKQNLLSAQLAQCWAEFGYEDEDFDAGAKVKAGNFLFKPVPDMIFAKGMVSHANMPFEIYWNYKLVKVSSAVSVSAHVSGYDNRLSAEVGYAQQGGIFDFKGKSPTLFFNTEETIIGDDDESWTIGSSGILYFPTIQGDVKTKSAIAEFYLSADKKWGAFLTSLRMLNVKQMKSGQAAFAETYAVDFRAGIKFNLPNGFALSGYALVTSNDGHMIYANASHKNGLFANAGVVILNGKALPVASVGYVLDVGKILKSIVK